MSAPSSAQQPSSVNPQASAVTEQQLLQQLKTIEGRGTIPDVKSYVVEHPVGRDWQHFHSVTLRWIGGIAILGILAILVIFYLWRGMVMLKSGRSGRTIVRFNAFERFVHWMTATCFHHSGHHRPQCDLRQAVIRLDGWVRSFHDVVGMGEIRPQLSELPVHHRRGADLPDVDRRKHSELPSMLSGSSAAAASSAMIIRRPTASTAARRRFTGSWSSAVPVWRSPATY